jgi:6-phosphogluconolactonase
VNTFRKNGAHIEVWRDLAEVSERAAQLFTAIARQSIKERGQVRVALSGGSTPKALYRLLAEDAEQKYSAQEIWPLTHVFWTDERMVSPDDPQSNHRMAYETLLAHVPVPAEQIHRMRGEDEPERAAEDYDSLLEKEFGTRDAVFDLILLGMGADAHTASIFPNSPLLEGFGGDKMVAAVYVEKLGVYRLTLTPRVLNRARTVIFLVSGEEKAEALQKVFASREDDREVPARYVRPVDGELIWLVDEAAAQSLS